MYKIKAYQLSTAHQLTEGVQASRTGTGIQSTGVNTYLTKENAVKQPVD
jgi:hypothetical protein